MKNFFKHLIEWKMSACAVFTAAIFIYLSFCLVYDIREVSTGVLWGLFWVSAASSLIQAVCFSEWIIKKLRYTWRSLLFVLVPYRSNGSVGYVHRCFLLCFRGNDGGL